MNYYIDGGYLVSGPPYTVSWNSTTVANGAHTITAEAHNNAGVLGSSSITVNVSNGAVGTPTRTPTPGGTPTPVVKITAPVTGATVANNVTITVTASAAVAWVNFYIDGGYLVSGPPYSITWNSKTVANGTHTIAATAFGNSGALGTSTISVTVSNGVASPTPTSTAVPIKFTAPLNGATVKGSVAVAVQVSPAVAWTNFYIDGNYLVSGPPNSITWNSATVANGTHQISATANTNGGVIGTASVNVTVGN